EVIGSYRPAAIVVDGVATEPALARAWREAPEIVRIGIRRASRLDGRQHLVAARDRNYHLLLVPHDRGTERVAIPAGPAAITVGPLLLAGRDEALARDEARRLLGLPAEGPCALVQLGA